MAVAVLEPVPVPPVAPVAVAVGSGSSESLHATTNGNGAAAAMATTRRRVINRRTSLMEAPPNQLQSSCPTSHHNPVKTTHISENHTSWGTTHPARQDKRIVTNLQGLGRPRAPCNPKSAI
jgi:hypothetical protein